MLIKFKPVIDSLESFLASLEHVPQINESWEVELFLLLLFLFTILIDVHVGGAFLRRVLIAVVTQF